MQAVDLHAHVLPGVDDGPPDLEASLALARAAVAAGTSRIVATPHVNDDRFIAPAAIGPAVADLNLELFAAGIDLVVHAGAEVSLSRLLDLTDEELRLLRLGNGPYLLLECPFSPMAGDFEPLVAKAQARGHRVLLAHPERCPSFQREPRRLVRLVEAGALVQLTAGVLRGAFGSRTRTFAHELLRDELVHVLASDAHGAVNRPPGTGDALVHAERAVPGITARETWMTEEVPAAILAGHDAPEPPALLGRRAPVWQRLAVRAAR